MQSLVETRSSFQGLLRSQQFLGHHCMTLTFDPLTLKTYPGDVRAEFGGNPFIGSGDIAFTIQTYGQTDRRMDGQLDCYMPPAAIAGGELIMI